MESESTQSTCHSEELSSDEESTHFVDILLQLGAKILRLRCAPLRMTGFCIAYRVAWA